MWAYRHTNELYHYGVKGMKWGVRRTPEQLALDKNKLKAPDSTGIISKVLVSSAVRSGEVSLKLNKEKQSRHIKNSNGYVKGRSYLYGGLNAAQTLINELSGTGEPVVSKGVWQNKERVIAPRIIGANINPEDGTETETNKAMITYSKSGSHIFPRRGGK